MPRTNVIISALLAATFISSCSLAPDFKKPEITVGESYKEDADALMSPRNGRQISANELFFVTTRFKTFGGKRLRMGLIRV